MTLPKPHPAIPEAAIEAAQHRLRQSVIDNNVNLRRLAEQALAAAIPHLLAPTSPPRDRGKMVKPMPGAPSGGYPVAARVAELEREVAQWQAAAGQSLVRAEALEDRLETVERERDEALALASRSTRRLAEMAEPGFIGAFAARDAAVARARILGDKYNQWFERAEALEAKLAKAKSMLRAARTTLNGVVALDDEDAVEGSDLSASCQEVVRRIDAALAQEQRNG